MFNPYITVPLSAWLLAQWLKFSIAAFKGDINFRYLYASGGMPSVHSAVVTSLALTTLLREGSGSPLFGIAAVFAAVVIYDSLGVRRSTGEQAIVLNAIVSGLEEQRMSFTTGIAHVREVLGHQPKEVFWGIVLGALVAVIGHLDKLSKQFDFLAVIPKAPELYVYTVLLLAILVIKLGSLAIYGKRWKKADSQSGKLLAWLSAGIAVLGLFLSLAQYESISVLGTRWAMYVLLVLLCFMAFHVLKAISSLPPMSKEVVEDRKSRWLQKDRKKRRN